MSLTSRMPARPHARHERAHGGFVVGVDEVGRGPLAGPVVAAAVWLPVKSYRAGWQDSKLLPVEERERLHGHVLMHARFGIGQASVEEIDSINILHASMLAMHRALIALSDHLGCWPDLALIDGNRTPKELPCPAQPIVKGDGISVSIAAASILAKVTRDAMMRELHEAHPHYGWHSNAGYGTRAHHAGLNEHGITPHHRRTLRADSGSARRLRGMSGEKKVRRRSRLFPVSAQKLIEPLLAPSIKQRGFGEVQILTRWKEIVGPKLAAHCRPLHIQGGRGKQAEAALVVAVNPAFATDLQHQYPQIIERISTFCGAKLVSRLQLVQTPMAGTQTNEKLTMPGFPPLKPAPARASETTDETDPLEAALASLAKALQEKRRMA